MRLILCELLLLIAVTVPQACLAAVLGSPADVRFTADYDGTSQCYSQLLPTGFDATKQHDLIIALHGSGANRTQYASDSRDECRATRDAAGAHDMILVCPDYRASTSWMNAAAEADVLQIIKELKSQYHIGKVIITGASMGGTGSLTMTALHPELINGVCSINGLADFVGYESSSTSLQSQITAAFGGTYEEVPDEYKKRSAINSPGSFTMPMSIACGGNDTVVPAASVRHLYDTVRNATPKNAKTMSFYRPTGGHSTNYVDNAVALEYVIRQANGINTDLHPIAINTSFEYQTLPAGSTTSGAVDGWTASDGKAGVTRLSDADYAAKFDDSIPDGKQTALARNAAIFQFLGTTVRAGAYHLSLKAGSPKDNVAVGTFRAGFLTADTNIAGTFDLAWGDDKAWTSSGLTAGKWSSVELDWIVPADSAAIGKYLYVNLLSTGNHDVFFDNVQVSFTPAPEPGTMKIVVCGLVGAAGYMLRKGRQQDAK